MMINPRTEQAYQLLHDGSLAFARMEQQGVCVDVEYVENKKQQITRKIEHLEIKFKDTNFFKHWQHSVKGTVNINSPTQLSHFLYKIKKIKVEKETYTGQGSTDDEALRAMNIPELNDLLEIKKLKKLRDVYLDGFAKEQVDGVLHANFNLNLVVSYRSCIAKGTKILAMRDFIKYSDGVPIEEIKAGDYVYCFNDNLQPTIGKVLWAGKTGHRHVLRIYYSVKGKHKNGYVDVTPEHKIRLIDGSYEPAFNLINDFRTQSEKDKKLPKIRTLSCKRVGDELGFTGVLKSGRGILEHRFIYSKMIGELKDEDYVHHRNEIHLDHTPINLEKMSPSEHSSYHVKDTLQSPQARINNRIAIQKAREAGRYVNSYKKGFENPHSLKLSKFTCYRLTAEVAGHITKVKYSFDVFKNYLKLYNIDFAEIMMRYDKYGNYIWKSKLKELSKLGRPKVSKILGHNYYRLLDLYNLYGIDTSRKWGNQFGAFKPGNHNITKIEWLDEKVDVYDIDVEDYHNFFANEICVHNSSSNPNLQNIPKRDEESMQICRRALYPRKGHQLLEVDLSGAEVRIAACYHKDSTMLKYINDPKSDMHRDMAKQIFMLDEFDKEKHDVLRQATKNGFVFPEFYGDYYINCAENMACGWGKLPKGKWQTGQGIPLDTEAFTLADHLIAKGINSLTAFENHLKKIEKDFWENRFPEYDEWKDRWWRMYKKYGYVDTFLGFRFSGIMDRKQCVNYPVQATAFHYLLFLLIEIDKVIVKENWRSKIICQIHDSILFSMEPNELSHIVETIKQIMEEFSKKFNWLIVPMEISGEICEIDHSWAEKKKIKF